MWRRQQGREDDLSLEESVEITYELGLEAWVGFFQKSEKRKGISGRGKSLGKGLEMKFMTWFSTSFLRAIDLFFSVVPLLCTVMLISPWAASRLELPGCYFCCGCRRLSFCSGTSVVNDTALDALGHIWAIDSWFCSIQHVERWTRITWVKPLLRKELWKI